MPFLSINKPTVQEIKSKLRLLSTDEKVTVALSIEVFGLSTTFKERYGCSSFIGHNLLISFCVDSGRVSNNRSMSLQRRHLAA